MCSFTCLSSGLSCFARPGSVPPPPGSPHPIPLAALMALGSASPTLLPKLWSLQQKFCGWQKGCSHSQDESWRQEEVGKGHQSKFLTKLLFRGGRGCGRRSAGQDPHGHSQALLLLASCRQAGLTEHGDRSSTISLPQPKGRLAHCCSFSFQRRKHLPFVV